jgi:hypothetical protein
MIKNQSAITLDEVEAVLGIRSNRTRSPRMLKQQSHSKTSRTRQTPRRSKDEVG